MTDKNIAAIKAEIKCSDGKTAELAVLTDHIEASTRSFGVFTKKIWEYKFPAASENIPKEVLDITIDSVKEATTLKDLEVLLKYNAEKALRAHFEKPAPQPAPAEEETESLEESGEAVAFDPTRKRTLTPVEFQRMETIVVAYAKVLERLGKETMDKYHAGFYPISYLPYPKEKIRNSLQTAITHTNDAKMTENLQGLEKFLDHFIDDKMARKRNIKAKEESPGIFPEGGIPDAAQAGEEDTPGGELPDSGTLGEDKPNDKPTA